MPELPEVETIVRGLNTTIIGSCIVKAERSMFNLRRNSSHETLATLMDTTILKVERRAKYIIITLSDERSLLLHLGMSGRLLLQSETEDLSKHEHVRLHLQNKLKLVLRDPRRFGMCEVLGPDEVYKHPMLKNLGVEPLTPEFNAQYLHAQFIRRVSRVKVMIMNSQIVVGVGNIYASESLFLSGIHPQTPAQLLTISQLEVLVDSIKLVLQKAILAGGSTLRDYVNIDGQVGRFQYDFWVYGRVGESCLTCEGQIQRLIQVGRSTFFCPRCQR